MDQICVQQVQTDPMQCLEGLGSAWKDLHRILSCSVTRIVQNWRWGSEPGPRGPTGRAARRGPRAVQNPGGGAARLRSGAKTATATVVEEREPGIRAGPTGPERRSGEALAACHGNPPAAAPRARGAERRRAGPRASPRRPEQARGTVLQGISAEGQKRCWVGQGC